MKRVLITLVLAAVSLLCARAQSMDSLIEKYAYQKSAVTVTMPEQILKKMARRDNNDLLRKLTEIKIISISGSDGNCLRDRFLEDARRLTARYEVLFSVSNAGRWVSAYIDGHCREAITLSSDDEAVTLLYMKGDIDDDMQDALLSNKIRIK